MHHSTKNSDVDKNTRLKLFKNFIKSGNEFSKNGMIEQVEKKLIKSMKQDLKVE